MLSGNLFIFIFGFFVCGCCKCVADDKWIFQIHLFVFSSETLAILLNQKHLLWEKFQWENK